MSTIDDLEERNAVFPSVVSASGGWRPIPSQALEAARAMFAEIERFLTSTPRHAEPDRLLTTILCADIPGCTPRRTLRSPGAQPLRLGPCGAGDSGVDPDETLAVIPRGRRPR